MHHSTVKSRNELVALLDIPQSRVITRMEHGTFYTPGVTCTSPCEVIHAETVYFSNKNLDLISIVCGYWMQKARQVALSKLFPASWPRQDTVLFVSRNRTMRDRSMTPGAVIAVQKVLK